MAANIANTAEMANKANQTSENLEKASTEGKKVMDTLTLSVEDVAKNSESIQEMVQLIMDIAEQTNLLAMNAAIEAAHAGEYGKCFAVVAEEIRKLADKSSRSAKEIQSVVKHIVENIRKNLNLSEKTKESFNTLKKEIEKVRHINHEIAGAMSEQQSANQSILQTVNNLNKLIVIIREALKKQVSDGQIIENKLKELSTLAEETASGMEEEKIAIKEAGIAAEYISKISSDLKSIADTIDFHFKRFKTE